MFSQCNTCMLNGYIPYDTISREVWPHRGPCLLRFFFVHNETCVRVIGSYTYFPLTIPIIIQNGKTALDYARERNHPDIVEVLSSSTKQVSFITMLLLSVITYL